MHLTLHAVQKICLGAAGAGTGASIHFSLGAHLKSLWGVKEVSRAQAEFFVVVFFLNMNNIFENLYLSIDLLFYCS